MITDILLLQALGNRMHELLNEDDRFTIIHQVKDEGKKRELKVEEDEEDFLDEGGWHFFLTKIFRQIGL